ncbi:cysteine hydrolase [Alkalilimnicola sp. S0819]|nr:cysteine hydrolase [Alkalilimnicola sp. S0819]MPQ17619.1 isochorismatase family protein [Alkalilimnicola sp. S0819]
MASNDTQSFPHSSRTVLLLIDVINDLAFPGGEELLTNARPMADALASLKRAARERDLPVVYLNDNFGQWRSDFREVVKHALREDSPGAPMVRALLPEPDDYFVLKPRHSGFFGTTLETLLHYLGARRLVLGGLTTDMCVLFTAVDAYIRDYALRIPADCSACVRQRDHEAAITYLRDTLKADTRPGMP